jgi:hypothetical protein
MKPIGTQSSCGSSPPLVEGEKTLSAKNLTAVTAMLALVATFGPAAAAQTDALRALYETSATIPTNVEGINAYPAPSEGFNPLQATDEELAAYGIPLRPDKTQDPRGYSQWTRVATLMSNPRSRWNGELKPRRVRGSVTQAIPSAPGAEETTFGTTSAVSLAWSGVVNTLPLTKWSSKKSFSLVKAEFPVPVPQQAFNGTGGNICDSDNDQAAYWVGLGGFYATDKNLGNQSSLAQAGVDTSADCSTPSAYAFVEWVPGPAVQLFNVNPGDDIYVDVYNTSATKGAFFIEDLTLQQAAGYFITAPAGFPLTGNEAEFIVERPDHDPNNPATGLFPLANYVWSIWDFCLAKTFDGTDYGPGDTSAATFRVSMVDDSTKHVISVPSVDKGLEQLSVQDQGCAFRGGCTP